MQPAGTDAVCAVLVFLDLLESHPEGPSSCWLILRRLRRRRMRTPTASSTGLITPRGMSPPQIIKPEYTLYWKGRQIAPRARPALDSSSKYRMPDRRAFTPPWKIDEATESFCIRDQNGQELAYIYFEDEIGRRMAMKRLTKDEARRIAANIAKLPDLLKRPATLT
jgi:hypothetical protein